MINGFKFVILVFVVNLNRFSSQSMDTNDLSYSSGHLFGKMVNCFSEFEISNCLYNNAVNVINVAINDNSTWEINDYILMEKNTEWKDDSDDELSSRSVDNSISSKLLDLANSRTLSWNWSSGGTSSKKGGRKKHDKHKHKHGGGMLMMGGIAMVAMMTQFFLGKIAFVAGAALIVAKLALYFATMKQYFRDISVPATDHVVYADHGHSSPSIGPAGWQRSIYPSREDSIFEEYGNFSDNRHR